MCLRDRVLDSRSHPLRLCPLGLFQQGCALVHRRCRWTPSRLGVYPGRVRRLVHRRTLPNLREITMAASLASLVADQAKRVASVAETLASNLAGESATIEQQVMFGEVTQQLMAIRDRLTSENQNVLI